MTDARDFWSFHDKSTYTFFERLTCIPAFAMLIQSGILAHSNADTTGPDAPLVILDNACGTGIVTRLLCESTELKRTDMEILCGDVSDSVIQYVSERIAGKEWKAARARVVDAQDTRLPSNYFTHVLTNFGIAVLPDPYSALKECYRILRPGCVLALTTWKYRGLVPHVRTAFARVPGAPPFLDIYNSMLHTTGAWDDAAFIRGKLLSIGCTNIKVELLEFETPVEGLGTLMESVQMTMRIATQGWREDERAQYEPLIVQELEMILKDNYGHGAFGLPMTAIVASGQKAIQ